MCALKLVPLKGLYPISSKSSKPSFSTIGSAGEARASLMNPAHKIEERQVRSPLGIDWAESGELDGDGQEPFVKLKYKIIQLVAELFPHVEASSQLFIEEVGSGSFNRVIGVAIPPCDKRRDSGRSSASSLSKLIRTLPPQEYVVRIPLDGRDRFADLLNEIKSDVAILQVIGSRLTIPIPKVIRYELNEHNALEKPYVLQNRLRGQSLRILMKTLNRQQMASAVEQITSIIEGIASVSVPAAGFISTENLELPSKSHIHINQYPVPTEDMAAKFPRFKKASEQPAPSQTPLEYLVDHCRRWCTYEESVGHHRNKVLWAQLIAIARSLDRRGWLGDRFHLVHGDLYPRNILAIVTSPATVKITGIVDWDMSFFAPKFVALCPPSWAWMGAGTCEQDEENPRREPKDAKGILFMKTFLKVASEEFARFALSQECILARKLFCILEGGLISTTQRIIACDLFRQWNALYPTDKLYQVNELTLHTYNIT